MFDAARAAMLATSAEFDLVTARTHGGFIAAFGQEMVKTGHVSVQMGRLLNRAHEVRLVADYRGEAVALTDATTLVEQAGHFVDAIQKLLMKSG